jgi:hypothetical protein
MKKLLSWLSRGSPPEQRNKARRFHSPALRVEELESRLVPSVNTETQLSEIRRFLESGGRPGSNGIRATGYFLTTPGRLKDIRVTRDAFGDPEVIAIGLDNQVYAERMSADGLSSTGFFLTARGQVASISVGRDAFGDPELFALGLMARAIVGAPTQRHQYLKNCDSRKETMVL